jgi:hypothetical protein
MWHMNMMSDCKSVAGLRWTARTIWQKGCKPSAYLTLEQELSEAIELCWLQATKNWCTDPPKWSKPCSVRMWAWCPSCLNPNRRTTNRLTQGRDVSSGKCSPAKFLKAGPACTHEWPRSRSRDVFNSKLVWHKSSLVAVPAVPGMEFEQAVPRDLCSTKGHCRNSLKQQSTA